MGKKILFSPVGGTDPISENNYRDGSMLHICRHYKPDKVILYLSKEMAEKHHKYNPYGYCIEKLAELQNRHIDVEYIERNELTKVQEYDYFYKDFRNILKGIMEDMDEGDEFLLNISSGTPAMKSGLVVLKTLGEIPCRTIQVVTPSGKMNEHSHQVTDYAFLWELDEDNITGFENRCIDVECPTLSIIKKEEVFIMRIALIMENSQAAKNDIVYNALKGVAEAKGHTVDNYGMYSAEDKEQLTYVQNGILAAILINSGAADFVVTGCGTGEGAMIALNSFPGVLCGHVVDPSDAYMFMQVNDGNAIALPFAKGFGWGAELNLQYVFEKLFEGEPGGGYPKERVVPEQRNKKILDGVRAVAFRDNLVDILKDLDQDLVKGAVAGQKFKDLFFANCKNDEIAEYVKTLLA